jgi:elongation factor Ts
MMDCKKALAETNGNIEEAVDWLRKKGMASAAKKADRAATEGVVAVATTTNKAVLVEVNAETDFVARNDQFQTFARDLAKGLLTQDATVTSDLEAVKALDMGGKTAQEQITNLVATIGENMNIRRAQTLSVTNGAVVSYLHNPIAEGLGKIGVLVAIETPAGDKPEIQQLGKQIAMHIAATRPESLSRADIDPTLVERERAILVDQARASGKPEEIIAKMIEGRISKFYEEVVLLEQTFVIDGESKVSAVVEKVAATLGVPVTVTAFTRFTLGEGLEKKEDNFAAEVAAMAG